MSTEVLSSVDGGQAAFVDEARVTISDTDPGAIGAGNIWLQMFDDVIGLTGRMFYQPFIRNAADTAWLPPVLAVVKDGLLRGRISLDYTGALDGAEGLDPGGGDIEVIDVDGNSLMLMAWRIDGEVVLQNNHPDGFTWVNRVRLQDVALLIERNEAHAVTIDDTGVSFSSSGGQVRLVGAPTADPSVPYALWTDAGVVKMSAP